MSMTTKPKIWSVGHSTRSQDDFIALLVENRIQLLVDVRHHPGSKKHPHFFKDRMAEWLPKNGIEYKHLVNLGGRRKAENHLRNNGWRVASFKAHADHMESGAFEDALSDLKTVALKKRTAYMCAEAVWWKCHRRLISDVLKVDGWKVHRIITPRTQPREHPFSGPARVVRGKIKLFQRKCRRLCTDGSTTSNKKPKIK